MILFIFSDIKEKHIIIIMDAVILRKMFKTPIYIPDLSVSCLFAGCFLISLSQVSFRLPKDGMFN